MTGSVSDDFARGNSIDAMGSAQADVAAGGCLVPWDTQGAGPFGGIYLEMVIQDGMVTTIQTTAPPHSNNHSLACCLLTLSASDYDAEITMGVVSTETIDLGPGFGCGSLLASWNPAAALLFRFADPAHFWRIQLAYGTNTHYGCGPVWTYALDGAGGAWIAFTPPSIAAGDTIGVHCEGDDIYCLHNGGVVLLDVGGFPVDHITSPAQAGVATVGISSNPVFDSFAPGTMNPNRVSHFFGTPYSCPVPPATRTGQVWTIG